MKNNLPSPREGSGVGFSSPREGAGVGLFFIALLLCAAQTAGACTNLIVGRSASSNGSVIVSYSADDYGSYGYLFFAPRAKHKRGVMRPIYHYETGNYLGEIPEARETFQRVGLTNEWQVTVTETTFGGREELWEGKDGIVDYGSLMLIALERARTAREAIDVMTETVARYGYASEGETFTVADKNEVWLMEMIGKGREEKGAVWVALRVPDDCITAHANQSRIGRFPLNDPERCRYSKDVITFARRKGYYKGENDGDFSFREAYAPADFVALRCCEARVWSFFNRWGEGDMERWLPYVMGDAAAEALPLWVKPKKKLTCQDVKDMMRDHYEGTPLAIDDGVGAGPYRMPYRPTPLVWEADSVKYFHERPISTQQTACVYVAEMRSWMPDWAGSCLWYGNDDANMIPLVPLYPGSMQTVPECFHPNSGNAFTFSFRSAYWLQNWVSNMVYARYCQLFPELRTERDRLERDWRSLQADVEREALARGDTEGRAALNAYSHRAAGQMMDEWSMLAQRLIVKYNDMAEKATDAEGRWLKTPGGQPRPVKRPGYPEAWRRRIVDEEGGRYKVR